MGDETRAGSQFPDKKEQNTTIIDLVRSHGPILPKELYKLVVPKVISHGGFYRRLPHLIAAGYLRRLDDGRLVPLDYSMLEEEIEEVIRRYREVLKEEPTLEKVALAVGKPPEDLDFRKAFFRVAQRLRWNRTPAIIRTLEKSRLKEPPFKDAVFIAGASADLLRTNVPPEEMLKEWKLQADEWWESVLREHSKRVRTPSERKGKS